MSKSLILCSFNSVLRFLRWLNNLERYANFADRISGFLFKIRLCFRAHSNCVVVISIFVRN